MKFLLFWLILNLSTFAIASDDTEEGENLDILSTNRAAYFTSSIICLIALVKGYCSKDDIDCGKEAGRSNVVELLDEDGNVVASHKISDEAMDNIKKQKEAEQKEQERLEEEERKRKEEEAQEPEKFRKMYGISHHCTA